MNQKDIGCTMEQTYEADRKPGYDVLCKCNCIRELINRHIDPKVIEIDCLRWSKLVQDVI